jgi:hypothetical protein
MRPGTAASSAGQHPSRPSAGRRAPNRFPGDLLLHPACLLALALVILNDRVLKVHTPGFLTGKLSGFAGLVYFPLFVVAALEGARWLLRRHRWELGPRSILVVSALTGAMVVLIKTWGPAAEFYRANLGVVLWPAYAPLDLIQGRGLPPVRRVGLAQDLTDLVSLVALVVPIWIARRVMVPESGRQATTGGT